MIPLRAQTFATLLDLTAPPFQDSHPGFGGRPVEERQVHTESVIGVVLGAGVRDEFGEPLLAGIGELVHATGAAHLRRTERCGVFDDQAVGLHAAQRRVQRAIRKGAEGSE